MGVKTFVHPKNYSNITRLIDTRLIDSTRMGYDRVEVSMIRYF